MDITFHSTITTRVEESWKVYLKYICLPTTTATIYLLFLQIFRSYIELPKYLAEAINL